jgi:2-oxoisovalerate dehydrogenase E1 component
VRSHGAPFFQVLDTYRLAAHSKGDDDRDADEIESFRRRDPLLRLQQQLPATHVEQLTAAARQRVDAGIAAAEGAPFATVDVRAEAATFEARGDRRDLAPAFAGGAPDREPLVVHNLNAALHEMMAQHDEILLVGEDLLDPYGGAFKVSRGLSTRFRDRVLAAPISEAGIIGIASGLSLRGLRPIVEIMFGDFLALGADQIVNHAAKFHWMYNEQVETPLVIRTPVGGHRGYGPTHSQSLEKMFLGVPGLVVVAISLRHDPGELLRRAVLLDPRPTLFLEQKILYAKRLRGEPPAGLVLELHEGERDALYPTGTWRPTGAAADVTVVTYGALTEIVEEAMERSFDAEEILVEYLVPAQLAPLRVAPIVDSVRRTGRLVVVEEGTTPWGFGAEVVARVSEALRERPPRVARVGAHHLPIPSARPAEEIVLPDAARVFEAIRSLVR